MRALLLGLFLAAPAFAHEPWEVDDCGLQPPGSVPFVPLEAKAWEPVVTPDTASLVRVDRSTQRIGGTPAATVRGLGALAGKVVYLSPGHGFTWEAGLGEWRTQRGNTNAIVEDLVSVETLSQYVMPMLLNAGARVVPVRELDLNTNLVLVDNGEAGYLETGSGFSTSSLMGWGRPTFPMSGATLPFSLGTNQLMLSAATATASATYTASIPASGYYDVSVSYTAFTARVTDAHYLVRHAGGETHFRVNQQRHGGTWVQLGRFYFRQGGTAQVVVQNDSTNAAGSNISLDAVKFGGGLGLTERGAGPSGRPRFEESSRYQAQWAGAPTSVWAPSSNTPGADRNNDISTRSRFTAWVHEPGEDAVYVAWHTNAFNASAVGTNTYVYGPNPPDGNYNFTGVPGSDRLGALIHAEMINDIKATSGWNRPTWQDRGVDTAYFGELNPSNNGETPAVLLEVAFHDAAADASQLKEPAFRYLAARSIAQGIIKYFAEKDAVAVRLPPEPPTHLAAVNQGSGEAVIRWRAPPTDTQGVRGQAATGYRLYSSDDGLGWDNGLDVTMTTARVAIPPVTAKYFRVTATNPGGESFPSAVVGVKAPVAGKPLVLVVNGFDRLEAAIGKTEAFATRYSLGNVLRVFIERMNDGSAARITGQALDANEVGFDTAESDAVTSGDVAQGPYQLLTWFVGRGKQGGAALTAAEQGVVRGFRMRNLPVFFTGAGTADAQFITDAFSGTVPGTTGGLQVNGAGALMGLSGLALDDGSSGSFDTGAPPAVAPAGAAVQLASYVSGGSAAIGTPAQSVMFGFPFETLVDPTQRVEVMRRVLSFLSPGSFDGGLVQVDAGTALDAGAMVPDAGPVMDGGASGDGGTSGDAGSPDAGGGGGPGLEGSPCVLTVDCAGTLVCRRTPDQLAPRCLGPPVLAFQGGGCCGPSAGPVADSSRAQKTQAPGRATGPLSAGEGGDGKVGSARLSLQEPHMAIKFAINGFGRIGRMVLRAALLRQEKDIEIVAINDLDKPATLAHLFKYDSVHRNWKGTVSSTENSITIDGKTYKVFAEKDPAKLPWKDLGVDVVMECTGRFTAREKAELHLTAGAKKVLLSAPGKNSDLTVCFGINHLQYDAAKHHIISNASCTTNCLSPVAKVLHDSFGIERGLMTTIHSYTNDQRILDLVHDDLRRARAAGLSMIPSSTGAAKAIGEVIPELKGRLSGSAIRVPTPNVSLVDLTVTLKKATTVDEVHRAMKAAADGPMKGVLQYDTEQTVSIDYNDNPHSSIFDSTQTQLIDGTFLKIFAWYDNEWGYSERMVDVAKFLISKN